MKLTLRSLFLKIFLWFWATVILTGIALIFSFVLQRNAVPARWHTMMEDAARFSGSAVVAEMEKGGPQAASAYLEHLAAEAQVRACLLNADGSPVAGKQCAFFSDLSRDVTRSGEPSFSSKYGIARSALRLTDSRGRPYIFATELPAGPRAAFGADRHTFLFQWGVAFAVSGLICYFLTRYLTAPILQLREASQRLAQGDLATRAAPEMEHRQDELGRLVGDFNAMADRIEELINSQRQMISDISHELRSPLARLNVALDLLRERKGDDPSLEQMEQDLEALNEMAGRLLTVARLDTSPEPVPFSPVNLEELVTRIVSDADFESRKCDRGIHLTAEQPCWTQGNAELLHSAIENVVRNAIRYTGEHTSVDVHLDAEGASVQLVVRDYGPGIPVAELANIFRPFYRVDPARDRQSGGAGLGLAIAERVIRLHQGTIRAENAAPHGLQVRITLPRLPEGYCAQK
jgi:two-component system sensor histidine kinase CpxA